MTTPSTTDHHRGRAVGRAGLVCALVTVVGLIVLGIGFLVVTAGDPRATQDFSWYFALFVLPAVVILTVLLFLAAVILGIIGIAKAGGRDRRPAVVAIIIAVAVIAIYVAGAIILGALLSPSITAA
jgi:uncharacterized membrane protein